MFVTIIYILMCTLIILLTALPMIRESRLFKYGHRTNGTIIDIISFLDINKKESRKVKTSYSIESKTYFKDFTLKHKDLNLSRGDTVSILYDLTNPKTAHISVDDSSLFSRFKRLILTMTATIVLSICLRSILINLCSDDESFVISLLLLCYAAMIFIIIISIYAYIYIKTAKSDVVENGIIIDKIEHKNEFTYRIKYNVTDCVFTFLYNSEEDLEIGNVVKVAYLKNMPFISKAVKS